MKTPAILFSCSDLDNTSILCSSSETGTRQSWPSGPKTSVSNSDPMMWC